MTIRTLAAATTLAGLLALPASATSWKIDTTHSHVGFSVKHLVISNVKGNFGKFSGTIDVPGDDLTKAVVDVSIDVASIDTNEPKRDDHLRSPDFFDVAKWPAMTFKSKKVEKAGDGRLKITGDLTIRDQSREVVLDVEGPTAAIQDPWGNTKVGAAASTTINRKDFGMTWNKALETGGLVVGDEVKISLELELNKVTAPAAPATK